MRESVVFPEVLIHSRSLEALRTLIKDKAWQITPACWKTFANYSRLKRNISIDSESCFCPPNECSLLLFFSPKTPERNICPFSCLMFHFLHQPDTKFVCGLLASVRVAQWEPLGHNPSRSHPYATAIPPGRTRLYPRAKIWPPPICS